MAKLKEMFPTEEYSVLEETLKSCSGDVNQAAAQLAGCKEGKHFIVVVVVVLNDFILVNNKPLLMFALFVC